MFPYKRKFLRCVSYCTAGTYDLVRIANSFKREGYRVRLLKDVLHLSSMSTPVDLFFFNHGCFVSWGLSKRQEIKWLEILAQYSTAPIEDIEIDYFVFCFGDTTTVQSHARLNADIITLESDNDQTKLSMSYALAQSVKLEDFEESLQKTIKKTRKIPLEIAQKGKTSLSRRVILKQIGEIFLARSSINLNSEYLDTPEFFWRNPHLELFYIRMKSFLDIPGRVAVLNQKLDVLQDLLDILNGQVQHLHSSILEITVIILILIEIAISLFHP
jgi:uncharacterized Rmd1/YagE family protein